MHVHEQHTALRTVTCMGCCDSIVQQSQTEQRITKTTTTCLIESGGKSIPPACNGLPGGTLDSGARQYSTAGHHVTAANLCDSSSKQQDRTRTRIVRLCCDQTVG
jgi:hypothetical protein